MSSAPATDVPDPREAHHDEEMPRISFSRKQIVLAVLFILVILAAFYFVLPKLAGLKQTWHRLDQGDPLWLILAAVLEFLSFIGYVALFRTVCLSGEQDHRRIDWGVSYQITMAGLAATRLFAAAGAGGIALTAWALRRSGMAPRVVAVRMVAMNVLLYFVYMATLVVVGVLLRVGVFSGGSPFGLTVLPALFGASAIIIVGSMALLPADAERRFSQWSQRTTGRLSDFGVMLAKVPAAAATGVREAISIVRRRPSALGAAIAWWAFDIATLWACFHAFGTDPPPIGVIVMCYFVGTAGNLLPLPGGVGGVEGGMIAAFVAFGVPFGYATVAVLSYRALSFWLPTIPGAIAYVQLRGTVKHWREDDAALAEQKDGAVSAA